MSYSLSLKNGPTFFLWDGEYIFDLLGAVESVPKEIRANITIFTDEHVSNPFSEQLALFDVKAVDAYGVCLHGSLWDDIGKLGEVIGVPVQRDEAFICSSLVRLSGSRDYPIYTQDLEKYTTKIEKVQGGWLWDITNIGGKLISSGETNKLIEAINHRDASIYLLLGGR